MATSLKSTKKTMAVPDPSAVLLDPSEIIQAMIDLRMQVAALEQQIQTLQPAFYAACALLNTEKITLERAVITRRLTPGQWDYSAEILQQEALFKQLKQDFQQWHEPTSGREVYWMIRLLMALK